MEAQIDLNTLTIEQLEALAYRLIVRRDSINETLQVVKRIIGEKTLGDSKTPENVIKMP
jgi:hypothetical protein